MGHESTVNLPHSSTPPLYHLYFTSHHHQPKPRLNPPITIAWVQTSGQAIFHNTYWLTKLHIANFRDVPLIEVSVEFSSLTKHCRKKRRQSSFTVNTRREARRTLIKFCGSKRRQTSCKQLLFSPSSQYLPSHPHECLCITSSPPQPKLPTKPSNHNSMSSRHVKSFSNIRIDLLVCIVVTSATFHRLRFPLKAEA